VFLIQMNSVRFLFKYLSPNALAAFRLASPGAFAGAVHYYGSTTSWPFIPPWPSPQRLQQ
jgi:hypothetical protein